MTGSDQSCLATEFSDINFPKSIQNYMAEKGFANPTPVQTIGFISALSGRDFVGIGQVSSRGLRNF